MILCVFILLNIKSWVPFWKYVSVPQLPRCSADMIRLKLAQRTLSAGDKTGLSGGTETMVWISVWAFALMSASKLWRLERVENSQRFSPFLSPFVFGCLWALQWFENLEVRLLISRNREPGQPEKQRNKRQAALFMKAVVSAASDAYF